MANYVFLQDSEELSRVNAGFDGSNRVMRTSLREVSIYEGSVYAHLIFQTLGPVIYVAGRPHLRLVDHPLENVEYVNSSSNLFQSKSFSGPPGLQ